MKDLLLHQKTRIALERAATGAAQALLLVGELGAGKSSIAHAVAGQLLDGLPENSPYFLSVHSDAKSIGIEKVRELQKFLQLKTTGTRPIRRVVIIGAADTMTVEAQNALLKILEEPPADTVIVLTAHQPQQLRPTIHSRLQTITIIPPAKSDILMFFMNKGFSGTEIEKAFMLSNGQVGLMTALLDKATDHDIASQIVIAKQLYGLTAFERLVRVDEIAKQKEQIPSLLYACKRICITALEQAALKNQTAVVKTWHKQLKLIADAENSLKHNPNSKLLLTDLFLNI